jgi:hypothetical protein
MANHLVHRHLEKIETQGRELRERLFDEAIYGRLEDIMCSDSFLDTWAASLGYLDWESLVKGCKEYEYQIGNSINVITPSSITEIANNLRQQFRFSLNILPAIESCLFSVTNNSERKQFNSLDKKYFE